MLRYATDQQVSSILPPVSTYQLRLQTHIFTDKVVYRPNDVMFIEVLVLDAFNKTPTALDPTDQYNYNLYLSLEIKDPAGTSLKKDFSYAQNSTAVFTYKVPASASGGEYTIKVASTSQVTPATKLVRIRDYPRDAINVKVDLPLESYRPGDTVLGSIKVELPDGSAFETEPSFEMSANFDT